jgi:hypothetical protein
MLLLVGEGLEQLVEGVEEVQPDWVSRVKTENYVRLVVVRLKPWVISLCLGE